MKVLSCAERVGRLRYAVGQLFFIFLPENKEPGFLDTEDFLVSFPSNEIVVSFKVDGDARGRDDPGMIWDHPRVFSFFD
ncbi:MAG: hypothetical protein KKD73_00750 [Proteobacteria bacterium]|nr:hypothetical protein [Pseudomonadota bacterium]